MERCYQASRNKAHRAYLEGKTIRVLPCKINSCVALRPEDFPYFWFKCFDFSLDSIKDTNKTFDHVISMYEFYNCNEELGYYVKYFIVEKEKEDEA